MLLRKYFPSRRAIIACPILLLILLPASQPDFAAAAREESNLAQSEMGLEIGLPLETEPYATLAVSEGRSSMTLIVRQRLKITDPKADPNFTAVDIWAQAESGAIKVRLSIIYNDLSNQEWWKNKKEKILRTYLVHEGETVRPAELAKFGIEPFEMRSVNASPIVYQLGQGPRIINQTKAVEVVQLEKSLDHYQLTLRNISTKNIVSYALSFGGGSMEIGGGPLIAAGALYTEKYISGSGIETNGITIKAVVFEDGSFEGDPEFAAGYLATREGVRIQSPLVLRLIEQCLEASDAELPAAFEKLKAQLQAIPEAIDKPTALELLRSKFPSFDTNLLANLYERLKSGLYEARNFAFTPIAEIKEQLQGQRETGKINKELEANLLRKGITQMRETFENMINAQR